MRTLIRLQNLHKAHPTSTHPVHAIQVRKFQHPCTLFRMVSGILQVFQGCAHWFCANFKHTTVQKANPPRERATSSGTRGDGRAHAFKCTGNRGTWSRVKKTEQSAGPGGTGKGRVTTRQRPSRSCHNVRVPSPSLPCLRAPSCSCSPGHLLSRLLPRALFSFLRSLLIFVQRLFPVPFHIVFLGLLRGLIFATFLVSPVGVCLLCLPPSVPPLITLRNCGY